MEYNMGPFKPNKKGKFDPTENYKYFDMVLYNGSSYLNINRDLLYGVTCIGILPVGEAESELYWQCIAEKGEKGDAATSYLPFIEIDTDGVWDFNLSDKAYLNNNITSSIDILNVYSGACGILISDRDNFSLPSNSDYSLDYNYVRAMNNQYYMYSFVCMPNGENNLKFLWNRTVMNRG